jgi:CsoR family transcriptional regulator, copper-sensing transcriptional repressor
MEEQRLQDLLKRLSFIAGHLAGIQKMVQEDKYCVDLLRQTYAVRKAIEKVELLILEGHLQTCVPEGMKDGRGEQVIQELLQIYRITGKQ